MATYTRFVFYANTPLTNMSKSLHFNSNEERDNFFDTAFGIYRVLDIRERKFNMVRDRLTVRITYEFDKGTVSGNWDSNAPFVDNMLGVNYCYFVDENSNMRYYCQVTNTRYINDKVTEFSLAVDVITTFFQGEFSGKVGNVHVKRQHLPTKIYEDNSYMLGQGDGLRVSPPRIIKQDFFKLGAGKKSSSPNSNGLYTIEEDAGQMVVLFNCSSDLSADFGDEDEPRMKASPGGIYDYVASPVTVYVVDLDDSVTLFKELSNYPWIAQNVSNINIIPKDFIDKTDLERVSASSLKGATFSRMKKNGKNSLSNLSDPLSSNLGFAFDDVNAMVSAYCGVNNILKNEKHLYNSSYLRYFVTNWSGSSMNVDPEKLANRDLTFRVKGIIGYDNKVVIYPSEYNSNNENLYYLRDTGTQVDVPRGEFLGQSITFSSWDSIPVLIDNYKKFIASDAYQRELTQDTLTSSQVDKVLENPFSAEGLEGIARLGGTYLNGAISNASQASATGGPLAGAVAGAGTVLGNTAGQWVSERQYWKNLKAQRQQMKITPNTITNASLGNAFAYRNGFYGISVKLYAATPEELVRALKYHKVTGYSWDAYEYLQPVNSMTHINYVEFDGDWIMEGVPTEFQQQAKRIFSQGVSLYHNPDRVANPFGQDPIRNTRRI